MLHTSVGSLEMVCATSVEHRLRYYACSVAAPQGSLLGALGHAPALQHVTAMRLVQLLL